MRAKSVFQEFVDGGAVVLVKSWDEKGGKVCCVAVFCGKVRLIDNIVFN